MRGSGKNFFRYALILLVILPGLVSAESLTSSVDRTALGSGETLELTVQYSSQSGFDSPNFDVLEHDFKILANSRQNNLSWINGQSSSTTTWQLTLLPKRTGSLVIPSLHLDNAVSDAIPIQVTNSPPKTSVANKKVFVETSVDKAEAYVQEQIMVVQRIYLAVNLDRISRSDFEVADADVVELDEKQYQKIIDGIRYNVVELRHAVFPQKSGELVLPAVRFSGFLSGRSVDPFFGRSPFDRGERIQFGSEQRQVRVLPRPDAYGNAIWLPSPTVEISQEWSGDPSRIQVGEPITRTLKITAQGVTSAQLPELKLPAGDGYRLYPDQPRLEQNTDDSGVIGTRTESVAIVPTRPGTVSLPAIRLQWWDSINHRIRYASLDPTNLQVAPASTADLPAGTGSTAVQPETTAPVTGAPDENPPGKEVVVQSSSRLLILMMALNILTLLLALVFLLLWWRSRKKLLPAFAEKTLLQPPSADQAIADIKRAAKEGDAAKMRRGILLWAQRVWPAKILRTLDEVARQCSDDNLRESFRKLDAALFAPGAIGVDLDLKEISGHLEDCAKRISYRSKSATEALPPLYPLSAD